MYKPEYNVSTVLFVFNFTVSSGVHFFSQNVNTEREPTKIFAQEPIS